MEPRTEQYTWERIDFNREKEEEYRIEVTPHVVIAWLKMYQVQSESIPLGDFLNFCFFWFFCSSGSQLHYLFLP